MEEFDGVAGHYRAMVDGVIIASGEGSEYFARYKAAYLERVLGDDFRGRILDFGCGIGLLAEAIKRRLPHCRLDGFDVSTSSIREVRSDLAMAGTFTTDPARLAGGYEVLVLANVLHHVAPERRDELIVELCGRLVVGGRLIVFEHNPINPFTRRAVSRCEFDRDAVLLPVAESLTLLKHAGLRVCRRDYIVFFPRALWRLRALEPSLRWCPVGAQYAVVAERVV